MSRRNRFLPPLGVASAVIAVVTLGALLIGVAPAEAVTFSNPAALTMADATCGTGPGDPSIPGKANLYPSNIVVSGQSGTITDLNVTLTGMTGFSADFSVLLVGPGGGAQNLVLVSDAGSASISNVTLTLDDEAPALLPASGAWAAPNTPVTAKPTDYFEPEILPNQPADTWPAPAPSPVFSPAPTGAKTLSSQFDGISPNGTWSLYVVDDGCGDASSISGGWSLDLTLSAAAAATTTTLTSSQNPSNTGNLVTFSATVTSGASPVTTGTVTFTEGPTTLAANVPLNGSGVASFGTSTLPEGNHVITATYNGVPNFGPSSGSVNQRVDNVTQVTGNTFCNTGAITIPTSGTATPYPSNIFVSSFVGTVGKVTATLKNVTHPFAEDIDVLLVAPAGQNLVLVSDAGSGATTNVTATFDDAAAGRLPASGPWAAPNTSVTVKPTDYDPLAAPDTFPAPAPAVSAATTLATFNGANPNGTWSLYVVDDAAGDAGSISGGWCITLAPALIAPTITTQATPTVTFGSPISDTATVTGAPSPAPAPTGAVTFTLFNNAGCTGAPVFTSANRPLAGGPPPTASSAQFTPAAGGSYNWVAAYSGDANYPAVTSACGALNETSVVTKARPTISTQASAGGPIGTSVNDVATVSGGSAPTGDVTFRLFATATCTAEVFMSTNPLGAGGVATSGSSTPAAPGTYFWTAIYNGDANNDTASSGCNVPNESVTIVKASPTLSTSASPGTVLGAPVRDMGTLAGAFNPTGSVVFRLFSDNTCATQVFTSTNPLSGLTATSDWFTPTAVGTYYWTAVYGGDANNNVATSACGAPNESVVIAPFAPPTITRTITGDFLGPLTVNAGESVLITSARVVGPVTVNPGGALTVINSQISRGITADAPSFFSLCGTQLSGPSPGQALSVFNAAVPIRIGDPANGCAGNRFAGDVNLTANLAVTFGANIVSGNVNVNNNGPGNTVLKANNIFAALACAGNNPPPTNAGQPNTAGSKVGQCVAV